MFHILLTTPHESSCVKRPSVRTTWSLEQWSLHVVVWNDQLVRTPHHALSTKFGAYYSVRLSLTNDMAFHSIMGFVKYKSDLHETALRPAFSLVAVHWSLVDQSNRVLY